MALSPDPQIGGEGNTSHTEPYGSVAKQQIIMERNEPIQRGSSKELEQDLGPEYGAQSPHCEPTRFHEHDDR